MYVVKQSTALTIPIFVHDSNGDAVTGLLDGGFTKRISKGSGAFAAMTVTISEKENGWYDVASTTTHSNTIGILSITLIHASAKQVNLQFRVEAKLNDTLNDFDAANDAVANVTLTATATNLTNLTSIPANWLTATGIAASALNGKGNWNIGKTGYTLTQAFPSNFSDLAIEIITGKVNTKVADTVTDGAKSATALSTATWTATIAGYIDAAISSRNATTPPTVAAIRSEMDSNSTKLAEITAALLSELDTGTSGKMANQVDLSNTIVNNIESGTIKKNTTGSTLVTMLDSSGNPVTSTAVTGVRRLDNGAFASMTATISNTDTRGVSHVAWTQADTNGSKTVMFVFSASGAVDGRLTLQLT